MCNCSLTYKVGSSKSHKKRGANKVLQCLEEGDITSSELSQKASWKTVGFQQSLIREEHTNKNLIYSRSGKEPDEQVGEFRK